jgi:hypothetical protein
MEGEVMAIQQGAIRYEAEWIAMQFHGANGEWDPDRDQYASSIHASKESAELAAIDGSRASGVEWILVAEQKYVGYEWRDQRRWTGDWEGLHDETLSEAS